MSVFVCVCVCVCVYHRAREIVSKRVGLFSNFEASLQFSQNLRAATNYRFFRLI